MEAFIGMVALIAGLEIGGIVENGKCEDMLNQAANQINQIKLSVVVPKCEPEVRTTYPTDISYIVDLKKSQVMILDKEQTDKVLKLPVGKK